MSGLRDPNLGFRIVCDECGSDDVWEDRGVNLNTGEEVDREEIYCAQCQDCVTVSVEGGHNA